MERIWSVPHRELDGHWRINFHGTPAEIDGVATNNVSSIIRNGFRVTARILNRRRFGESETNEL